MSTIQNHTPTLPISAQDEYTPSMDITISNSHKTEERNGNSVKMSSSKGEYTGGLTGALNYMQYYIENHNPDEPVNLQVNARISFLNKSLNMSLFREDRTYTFNNLEVAKRFFKALLQMQNERMMGAYNKPVPLPLSDAMKNFGLAYENGQPLSVPTPQTNNDSANTQPTDPVNTKPADSAKIQPAPSAPVQKTKPKAPAAAQQSAPKKAFSLSDFIARHKMDIFLTVITGGLYLVYLAFKEIIKQMNTAIVSSNVNSSSFSTSSMSKKGFTLSRNTQDLDSSKVQATSYSQSAESSKSFVSNAPEWSLSTDSNEEEVTRKNSCK